MPTLKPLFFLSLPFFFFFSSSRSEYVFNFDNTFELHQDVDVLKKMGLECGLHTGSCTPESLSQAKALLPKMFEPVLEGS